MAMGVLGVKARAGPALMPPAPLSAIRGQGGGGYAKPDKNALRPALLGRLPRLNGALQLVDVNLPAGPAAALGAAGRRLAEKSAVEDAPHVPRRRYEERANQDILNFDGSEGKEHEELTAGEKE